MCPPPWQGVADKRCRCWAMVATPERLWIIRCAPVMPVGERNQS